MSIKSKNLTTAIVIIATGFFAGCRTTETGGKLVDRNRGEIVISSPGDQRSALPDASKDPSLISARENLEQSAKNNPKDVQSLVSLAQLQLVQDRFKDAEATCRSILRIDVKNQEARKILAQAAIRNGNIDLAMIFLTALGGESSRDSDVLNMLALVSLNRGDSTDAMRLWKKALSLNSNDISVRMNLGVMYLKYRLITQASAQFERVLKVAPLHQDAKLHLAIVNSTRGKHEDAVQVYKEILAGEKANTLALYNLAVSQQALELYDDALDSLKRYIEASPGTSSQTDQAFAMIEDIQTAKQAKGEKISDSEISSLASSLKTKKAASRVDQSTGFDTDGTKSHSAATNTPATNSPRKTKIGPTQRDIDLGRDQDIDELENELKAH